MSIVKMGCEWDINNGKKKVQIKLTPEMVVLNFAVAPRNLGARIKPGWDVAWVRRERIFHYRVHQKSWRASDKKSLL